MISVVKKIMVVLTSLSLVACSVVMASRSNGVSPKDLTKCKTRTCLIAAGAVPIEKKEAKNGHLLAENFSAILPTGSAARAAMHGLLDVGTLGIWEVAGTPIEAVKGKKTGYVIDVKYENDGKTIRKMTFEF